MTTEKSLPLSHWIAKIQWNFIDDIKKILLSWCLLNRFHCDTLFGISKTIYYTKNILYVYVLLYSIYKLPWFYFWLARADQGSVKAPCQYRLAMGSINEGSDFSMHSATKFKCNFVVIDVVHSGIKMTGSYFSEFRWDEKCCNSLHEYKDYSKTHPLPQYAQMINFIPITKCSPKW